MYKNKDKAKQASKERMRRYRDKQKGVTNVTPEDNVTPCVTPTDVTPDCNTLPANFGQADCQCLHCRANTNNGNRLTINHGQYKTADQLQPNEVNRVSLPSDIDYIESTLKEYND
jgi:hypothetical protein